MHTSALAYTKNRPKRAGDKPREKKERKGQNNVELTPIVQLDTPADPGIDYEKPLMFTEIYHNNLFYVTFTRGAPKAVKCPSCKVEFPRGEVTCIPFDIAIAHKERYYYPIKNSEGKIIRMEPTGQKEATRYYCIKKECLLKRHSYFWRGLLRVQENVRQHLKSAHIRILKERLHFDV